MPEPGINTGALIAQLVAMRATIDAALLILTNGSAPAVFDAASENATRCEHPPTARVDLNVMGSGAEEHWSCRLCGHEHKA